MLAQAALQPLAMGIPEQREEVWLAMADQFLDSEERHALPELAAIALAAGLTPEEASRVFMFEVAPALAPNLWSGLGVWGAWDRVRVLRWIRRCRLDPRREHPLAAALYALTMGPFDGVRRALVGTMGVLAEVEGAERRTRVEGLTWLVRAYLGFDVPPVGHAERAAYRALFEECFARSVGLALFARERREGEARLLRALGGPAGDAASDA